MQQKLTSAPDHVIKQLSPICKMNFTVKKSTLIYIITLIIVYSMKILCKKLLWQDLKFIK